MRHPTNKTTIVRKRGNGVSLNLLVVLSRLRVSFQQRIHQAKQLHDTFVLPQIFVSLQKENVILPIAATQCNPPWPLLTGNNLDIGNKLFDVYV